jgi:hypothetical protein
VKGLGILTQFERLQLLLLLIAWQQLLVLVLLLVVLLWHSCILQVRGSGRTAVVVAAKTAAVGFGV